VGISRTIRRSCLILGAAGGLGLGLASSAMAASPPLPPWVINVTQFSKAVSGTAPTGATSVTVTLQRNGSDSRGAGSPIVNKVDGCTATPASNGTWSCSFASVPFDMTDDDVVVAYGGTIANDPPTGAGSATNAPSPTQITILGDGANPPPNSETFDSSSNFVNEDVSIDGVDSDYYIDYAGKTITCDTGGANWCTGTYDYDNSGTETTVQLGFSVSVAGGAAQSTFNETSPTEQALTFSTPVTGTQSLAVTSSDVIDQYDNTTDGSEEGGTLINVTTPGPELGVQDPPNANAPSGTQSTTDGTQEGIPNCEAYLVFDEVTCSNITPGAYTVSNGSSSATMTVPAATQYADQPAYTAANHATNQELWIPSEGGAVVPGLAGGQTVTVSDGSRVLDTIGVDSMKFTSMTPLEELGQNGHNTALTGSCTANLFVDDNPSAFCPSTGVIPTTNTTLGSNGSNASEEYENDLVGLGETDVFLPYNSDTAIIPGGSIFTPFTVADLLRYNDPITGDDGVNADNAVPPINGQPTIAASSVSTDPVTFQYATLNPVTGATGTFVTLGNVNTAGGLTLPPTLATGWYEDRYVTTDTNGDSDTQTGTFYNQGSTSPPVNITAAKCSAKVKGGGLKKATIAKAKKGKGKGKSKKKTSKTTTVTFSCSGTTGDRLALWIQHGNTVVADGSGTIKKGKVSIAMTGTGIKKGTYSLIEVMDQAGHSLETDQTVTLK
jgi:hypothetical protein